MLKISKNWPYYSTKPSGKTMNRKSIEILLTALLFLIPGFVCAADDEEALTVETSYVSLGKPLVLNLSTNGKRLTFLQISADVLVKNDDAKEVVETHIPAIRHELILLLSEQFAADMKSPAKREEVRQLASANIRSTVESLSGNKDIEEILFTSILVQ